ncbi:precorrin-2/cobalt-factor-2 C20-methyltransferase [Clostridium pascui]|uniref:cobalt-factor II C(20)-methyltransferase n=1 Tax=Clostridium pascui TaxID=46609 RepID=UPI00195E905E|nr:cobalt-factor II C(20)-methyltransferase [Clostridium pascui]MBM7870827.1 precorrin-2/cobalt-factor-2 C20-methyltransferase [Clostridium pascui]
MAKLYGVGVGPGSEELITLKALKVIQNAKVIVAPSPKENGQSAALNIVKSFVKEDTEVIVKQFPMGGEDQEDKIYEAFKTIEERLHDGLDVVFITIGDPFVYSTYIYLLKYINEKGYETETVPGITSFCASASLAGEALVIGDEPLLILPSTRLDTVKEDHKYLVIMKVYNNEESVINFLEDKGYEYVYVKRAYREGQEVIKDREEILKNKDYMSLIIAHKN